MFYALREGLALIEEEGLENRWERHHKAHLEFVKRVEALGLEMHVPNPANRIWNLNTPKVPQGVDDAKVRATLLQGKRHRDRRRLWTASRQDLPRRPDGTAGD